MDVVEQGVDPHHQNRRHKVESRKLHDILNLALRYVEAKNAVQGHSENQGYPGEPVKDPEFSFVLDVFVYAELVAPRPQQTDEEDHRDRELVHKEDGC